MCHNRDTIFNLSIDQSIYRSIDFSQVLTHLPRKNMFKFCYIVSSAIRSTHFKQFLVKMFDFL